MVGVGGWGWFGGGCWGPLRPLRGHLPLGGGGLWCGLVLGLGALDRVVRSVSASEQSDESGTHPSICRPPSSSMSRPDSRPGTKHQRSNPANHRLLAPGPHRGSRGTYGVVPRPEGPGEDGVLPGKQGVFGGRSPPLMYEQSALRHSRQRIRCSGGRATPGGWRSGLGPPPPASRAPPPGRGRTFEPTSSVSLDRVVRSVSVSEQGVESGTTRLRGPLRPLRGHLPPGGGGHLSLQAR